MKPTAPRNGNGQLKAAAARQRRYQLAALGFISLGVLLLAYNLGWLPRGLGALWPLLVILAGVFILFTGRAGFGLPPAPFAIERGAYEAGHLLVEAGTTDVRLDAFAGATQLAVGQFPIQGGPRLRAAARNSRAQLIFDHHAIAPFRGGDWTMSLARDLPWALTLRSSLGRFHLDLRSLNVASLDLRSLFGDVELTLPASGRGDLRLRLTFGDLTVRVPEGVAIRVRLVAGPLATVKLSDPNLIRVSEREWVTPNFSACPVRFTLALALSTGDLCVS
jgi:hypothetical protein